MRITAAEVDYADSYGPRDPDAPPGENAGRSASP